MVEESQDRSIPLAILLPTLNEEKGLEATYREIPFEALRSLGFRPVALVIDGHSTDSTVSVAQSLGAVVLLQNGAGKGAAVREGLDWAAAAGVPYAIVIDADATYPGSALPSIASLLAAGSDMVVGVRRPDRHVTNNLRGLVHRIGNGVLNFLAGYLSRGPILDICSGLWGIRTAVLPQVDLVSEGFDIEAEAFVKAFRLGLAVSQVPVVYRSRVGTAKLRALDDGARILLSIFRYARRPQAVRVPLGAGWAMPKPGEPIPSSTMRDIQSVLFALNSHTILVSAPPGRASTVNELLRCLRVAHPEIQVDVSASVASLGPGHRLISAGISPKADSGSNDAWSIVVTLPSTPVHGAKPWTTIRLPAEGSLVYLDLHSQEPEVTDRAHWDSRSRAIRLERKSGKPLSSLRLLSSSLYRFAPQRDLALIAANVGHSNYEVYRTQNPDDSWMRPPIRTPRRDKLRR